jgi:hypothetical protein
MSDSLSKGEKWDKKAKQTLLSCFKMELILTFFSSVLWDNALNGAKLASFRELNTYGLRN